MVSNKTITSIFMVPTLKISKDKLQKNNFINAYIDDLYKQYHFKDVIYLLFKPTNIEEFREFLESEYERTEDIIDDYDYPGGYVVVIYKLNQELKKDFNLIRNSQYSKTSKEFQDLFPKKVSVYNGTSSIPESEDSIQHLIFSKSDKLISFWENLIGTEILSKSNLEVWPYYDIAAETLNIKTFK